MTTQVRLKGCLQCNDTHDKSSIQLAGLDQQASWRTNHLLGRKLVRCITMAQTASATRAPTPQRPIR
ncbi:MAG: hypothetical protein AAGI24_03545, partial [Pseudomonadota bacterium]